MFKYSAVVGVALFLLPGVGFSQTHEIDSLKKIAATATGTNKVDILNTLAFESFSFDHANFTKVADEAIKLSETLKYQKGKTLALILKAAKESDMGENKNSVRDLKQCITMSSSGNETGLHGFALQQLGLTYQYVDQWDSAFSYYKEAYEILKDSVAPFYLSLDYMGFSDYYGFKNQYPQQLNYLKRAYNIRKNLKGPSRVSICVRFASFYSDQNNNKMAFEYLDEAQRVLGRDTIQNDLITAINAQRAVVYLKTGNYVKALGLFQSARKVYEARSYKKELTSLLISIGQAFHNLGNYEASLKNYLAALQIANANHFKGEQAKLQYSIAWVYYRLRQFKTAELYAKDAIQTARQNNHRAELASALNIMGLLAENQKRYDEALGYLNQALEVRTILGDSARIAATLFNIGSVYEHTNDVETALRYQLKSLAIKESVHDILGIAYSYQACGRLYYKLHDNAKASDLLDKAEALAMKIKTRTLLIDVYKDQIELLKAESKLKKALEYASLYQSLKDSAFDENMGSRLNVLEATYQIKEKENQILLLNQEKKMQEDKLLIKNAQIRQQGIILLFSIIGLVVSGGIAVVIFRYNKQLRYLNREISEKNEEIQVQAEELTESNQLISGINTDLEKGIEMRTSELKQAYKELDIFFYRSSHDFRRPLTTFMGLAEVAKITIKDAVALELFEKVNETARSLDKMLSKLQSVSDVGMQELIYSQVFIKDIFELELSEFKTELDKDQIQVIISVKGEKSFYSYPGLIRIIVRNLLENAIAFCFKTESVIHLTSFEQGNEIIIEVKDNGQGIKEEYLNRVFEMYFRANERSKGNGLGLYIVKKTVQKLNGRIEINSVFEIGTTVQIILPNQQVQGISSEGS